MPFKALANGKFRSPSGRVLTKAQVRAYYAKKKKPKQTPKANNRRRKPMGTSGMGG